MSAPEPEWEAPELDDEPDFSGPIDGSPEDIDQRIDDALYLKEAPLAALAAEEKARQEMEAAWAACPNWVPEWPPEEKP